MRDFGLSAATPSGGFRGFGSCLPREVRAATLPRKGQPTSAGSAVLSESSLYAARTARNPLKDSMAKKNSQNEPKASQAQKSPPELAGIEFADEAPADPRENSHVAAPVAEFTEDRNKKNQDAARQAIERMHHMASLPEEPKPVLPELTQEEAAAIAPKLFLVKEGAKIARGGSTYNLPAGKRITNRDYDIDSLREQGVKLEEVAPPT